MSGTLNHLLATDRIWMKRFTGQGEAPTSLDAILFDNFAPLRQARQKEDERIIAYIDSLSEANITGRFRYRSLTNPTEIEQPLVSALVHVFNHQTHHRGQVHCLLTGFGLDAPALDLVLFQRLTGIGMS